METTHADCALGRVDVRGHVNPCRLLPDIAQRASCHKLVAQMKASVEVLVGSLVLAAITNCKRVMLPLPDCWFPAFNKLSGWKCQMAANLGSKSDQCNRENCWPALHL